MNRVLLAFTLVATLSSGCVHSYNVPTQGSLGSEGVVITAEDGSFTLKPGERFRPPFSGCPEVWKSSSMSDRILVAPAHWSSWLERGAKRVRVSHPSVKEPLYGILAFCPVSEKGPSPVQRAYYVLVPDATVQKTEGGYMEVVFEPYDFESGVFESWGGATVTVVAWALFLSRTPFEER